MADPNTAAAAAAAAAESSLLSKLETSIDLSSIHHLFSSYLHPFSPILNKKSPKSSKLDAETSAVLRSLAKKFLPFLNKTLSFLPKRLSETPKIDSSYVPGLFETYKLCLSCLDSVFSQLSCKPHSIHIQRLRLIHCYENWGRYMDAQSEGFSVLESMRKLLGKRGGASNRRVVPELGKDNGDKDVALLIVEVVVTLVKCAAQNQSKEEEDYRIVLSMVDEIKPWFRVIDVNAYEKFHRVLLTYLSKCSLFLVGELASIDGDLAHKFCLVTFCEFAASSMRDQRDKFARRICSSIFSQWDSSLSYRVDILICVLDSIAHECKNGKVDTAVEFFELAYYCAIKCRTASVDFCGAVAAHFDKLAYDFTQVDMSPVDLIMRLYGIGLFISDLNCYLKGSDSTMVKARKDISILRVLLSKENQLQSLTATLGSLTRHYKITVKENGIPFSAEFKDLGTQRHSHMEVNCETSTGTQNGMPYMLHCFNALKFLCEPLSELVNSEKKDILAGVEGTSFPIKLSNMQNAFHQFFIVFLTYRTSERAINIYDDNSRAVLSIATAAFTLSFTTKENIKESTNILKHLISAEWIQVNGLKFLFASLYNIGVVLYREKRLEEATKSLELCCTAAWKCVLHLCKMLASNRDGVNTDLSEDALAVFVTEVCSKSAFLLDVLYQCGSREIQRILTDCLKGWSVAQSFFEKIPSPIALVKQWVKIECKLPEDNEVDRRAPTLYSLMSSSSEISKKALGMILEQELQMYKEMKSLNPQKCKRMQKTVASILLEDIYITKDSCLDKSRILIAKGRESRACGVEGLNDCIRYFSEAISTMNELYDESKGGCVQVRHQLAEAYCLRALCTQEAEPDSKHFTRDISTGLKVWLKPEHSQYSDQTGNLLPLLYNIADLLSIKGYMKDHSDIYELIIKLLMSKNVCLEKCLAMLWHSKSLSHALCTSPVDDAFIMTLSKYCNLSKSMEFWTSCMDRSQSLKVGFQQSLSFTSTLSSMGSYPDHTIHQDITIDEVKQAASNLITSVPLSSNSIFLAASLYYDLGERLIARGSLIEALFYAKEAHRLRSKLFQVNFIYSIEQQNEIVDVDGEVIQKSRYSLKTFDMHPKVAAAAWSSNKGSNDFEDCILTPWKVLQCYLESTLQMGIIYELVGNGSEAESILLWGKNISSFQGLSIFLVSFSASLGKLYRKQRVWHLAEKELESAKYILASCNLISCSKCRLILEVTVDQQLGDLARSRLSSTTSKQLHEGLSMAENLYRSAIDKLNLSEWKNCVNNSDKEIGGSSLFCDSLLNVGNGAGILSSHCAANQPRQSFASETDGKQTTRAKVARKNKKTTKNLPQEPDMTSRVTRSRFQSSKKRSECAQNEVQDGFTKDSVRKCVYACGCKVTCGFDKIQCWHCLPLEVMKSMSLDSFIKMRWECIRRRLLLRLLTGIGKCLGAIGDIHKAHEVLLESMCVLVSRNTFHPTSFSVPFTLPFELVEKHVFGDSFAIEYASILYNLCWVSLKSFGKKGTRNDCCDMLSIPIPTIFSGLKLSFILCRELPALFRKVSQLLAVLYTLSSSNEAFSISASSGKVISESQWASYFHQASLGTHLNHQLFSRSRKQEIQNTVDVEDLRLPSTISLSSLRLGPKTVEDLEGSVLKFFQVLPCATILCISMLGDAFAGLLRELSFFDLPTNAWIMLSRLNSDSLPVVILLPIDSILEEDSEEEGISDSRSLFSRKSSMKSWHCPWGHTVIDEVAPLFKSILEENYMSSSIYPLEDTKTNRTLWWTQRRKLDHYLGDFLRDMEDLWFGPWKFMFLGGWSGCNHLDSIQKKLLDDLKSECNVDVHESILKLIVGGAKHGCQLEECLSELILRKGCYIGERKCDDDESPRGVSSKQDGNGSLSSLVGKLVLEAFDDVEKEDPVDREPVILVLDFDIQMLPWENMPILRNQEVYRMPSVASIFSTFDRCFQHQEKIRKDSAAFPMIDPLDAYYLLNPSGDLSNTEAEFDRWFRDQNLEGKTGTTPTVEELSLALKSHDLFIYLGHGSGVQYIPGSEIQKLDGCAATLLMGCSSGSLSLNGPYTPKGAPLYYLVAGSPAIVANLWEVTDKDIDRFGKAMLDAWIRERSSASTSCTQCHEIADKLKEMKIEEGKRKTKKKASRKKSLEDDSCTLCCKHRRKIGSFMGEAREACTLPFLIGAAPVCYGVPTGIWKKDSSNQKSTSTPGEC